MARVLRVVLILTAIAIGAILAGLLAAQTPWARGRALAWASTFVTRYHLDLAAGDLSYNAVTRRVTLSRVRLAAEGHHDRPFLVAERIEVRLPWSVFQRRFAIDHLTIDRGIVDIYRDSNDIVNLPPGSDGPTPERPRHLDIRSLTLNGLDVRYEDQLRNWGVTVPRIESDLLNTATGATGRFGVRGALSLHLRDRVMTMAPFETAMTFDGTNVRLEQAKLSSKEIEAFLSGPITRVLDSPALDLTLKGTVHLDEAIAWVPPPPVPVSGLATIEGTVKGPARNFVVDLNVSSHTLDVGRERDLAVAGPVRVTFDAISGHDLVVSPQSGGAIRARFTVPWGSRSVSTAAAEWNGVDAQAALRLADVDPQAIGGTFDGRGTFEFAEPRRFVISNRSTGKAGRGVVPMTGTIEATIVGDEYRYTHANSFPGFDFDGEMAGTIKRGAATLSTMSGPAHARVIDVAEAAKSIATLGFPVADIMLRTHGAVDAPMTLGGVYRYPEVTTDVTGGAVDIPLLGVVRAAAHVVADTKLATISAIDLQKGSSEISGNAVANITARTWDGVLRLRSAHAEELQSEIPERWRVSGHMTANATLGGTFDVPRLDTTIEADALRFAGQTIDRATVKAIVTSDAIDVTSLEVHQGAGYLEGAIRYAWDTGAYTASVKGDRLSWTGTVLSPNDTSALFAMQFSGTGTTAQPRGRATIDFALSGGTASTFIGNGEASAELLGDSAHVVARLPMIGALINADVATAAPHDYKLSAQLDRFELARLAPFVGAIDTEILGFANGTITASGRIDDDRDRLAFVNITELDAGLGGVAVSLLAPLNAELHGEDVTLKDLAARVGGGRLTASGEWNTRLSGTFRSQFAGDFQDVIRLGRAFGVPAGFDGAGPLVFNVTSNGSRLGTEGTLELNKGTISYNAVPVAQGLTVTAALRGEQLTIERITGDVATGGVIGSFSGKGQARLPQLSLAAVDGALVLDSARFTFSGIPVQQQRPSRIALSGGTVTVTDVAWLVAEHPISIGGSIGLTERDRALDLSLNGIVDMRVLSAFTSTVAFDGLANVDARVGGTVNRPLLDGRITLDDAEIGVSEPRLLMSQLHGTIALRGQSAVFEGVRGLANGGSLILDGPVEFENMRLTGGELNIQAQGVAMEIPRGLRSELDALVTFRPDPRTPSLTGDIRVMQSAYTETITIAAFARQASAPVGSAAPNRAYLDRLQFNLAVTTTEDISVDNNYGRLAAGADVRLVGTAATPGMEGRITLREGGQIYLAGRTFRITRGDISFTDRRHIHPEFNIAAETNLGAGTGNVTMTLTGTLERPQVDLSSEEGARTSGEIAAQIVGSGNTETALTLLSADLLGVTGRAIGLDAFRVERGEFHDVDFRDYQDDPALIGQAQTDPTTRLTVSKRLSDKVEFTASQNLRENGKATFIISYFPTRTVELRAVSRDTGTLSIGIRHQITFGGGVSTPPSERRIRPAISAINLTGLDPRRADEARRQIKLHVGDAFDFLELQKTVDRISESFHRQGFFEARVRARRVESDDARTVALEFAVTQGPHTVLQVNGIAAPASFIAEMEEAWHKNVFDQFLVEDLTHRVRRYLVTTGELGSVVVGRVDRPSPDTKRLRIDVTPGAPVSGREFRFEGNTQLSQQRLLAEIADTGLQVDAWLDRTLVERALQQVYNEEGFLTAQVTGKPLTIDGSTGVLLFDINEGPRAEVTDIRWAGVADARLGAVEKAASFRTPAPYVIAAVNDARLRIEEQYRRQGFNDVEVDSSAAVSANNAVVLTFEVREGAQQVLSSVDTSGLDVTNGKVLTEALKFEFGKPVDLDEWALARKRLYDTNVFRLVDIQAVPISDTTNGVQPVKAVVRVEEYPAWSFRYGFQLAGERRTDLAEFTSTRNAGVVSELRTRNLFGRALTAGLFGMYERDRQDGTLLLATSRLFGWRARSSLYGFFTRDQFRNPDTSDVTFITNRQGISADQRWRSGGFQVVYGYRFERNHTYDPDPGNDPLPLDIVANLAKLSAAMLFDHRDDPINARKGTFSAVSFDQAAPFLGSDVNNRKLLMQQFVFVPLGARVTLASRVQSGFAFGRDSLLLSDRFRAGGATSVRGYSEDGLGPRDATGFPNGGERLLILNQEARFPLYRWAKGVLFVDAGNVYARHEDWNSLKVGYGAGLRFDTPVGLLRVDVGWAKSSVTTSSRGAKWYFGFGHIF